MYFYHVAGVVAQLETQAGLFWENQKQSGKPQMGWAESDLTGQEWKDLKVVSDHFGLPMLQAKQLIDFYKNSQH